MGIRFDVKWAESHILLRLEEAAEPWTHHVAWRPSLPDRDRAVAAAAAPPRLPGRDNWGFILCKLVPQLPGRAGT